MILSKQQTALTAEGAEDAEERLRSILERINTRCCYLPSFANAVFLGGAAKHLRADVAHRYGLARPPTRLLK